MKKHSGISLIETLISLTIVGVSIVALLPVMTLKNSANDPNKGSALWNPTTQFQGDNVRAVAASAVSIGTATAPNSVAPARASRPFIVSAKGFGNKNISPLYVQERLAFNGYEIFTTNNLHLRANYVLNNNDNIKSDDDFTDCDGTGADGHNKYLRNLYIDNNKTIIANKTKGPNNCVMYNDGGTLVTNNQPVPDNYVLLNNRGTDFIEIRDTNIGIGANALRNTGISSSDTNHTNNIVIANVAGNMPALAPADPYQGFIAIGSRTPKGNNAPVISSKDGYTIHYAPSGDASGFTINANLLTTSLKLNGLIIGSDRRLKNIIGAYKKGLYEIEKLKPVEFTYKSDKEQVPHVGVIAQELQEVFPDSVIKDEKTGYLLINTNEIFYALLNSIKELDAKNKTIQKDNDELEAKIAELRKIRDDLKAKKGGSHE